MQKGSKEVIWNTEIIIGFKICHGEGKYGIDIHNRHRSLGWKEGYIIVWGFIEKIAEVDLATENYYGVQ